MPDTTSNSNKRPDYFFGPEGFFCKDWSSLIRYEDITEVVNVPGNCCFDISFTTSKGKEHKVTVILDDISQANPLQTLLLGKVPGASAHTRPQTAWEACGAWVTAGLCLAGLVVLIIALNTWGRGTSVVAPIWMIPFLVIGSFLSTQVLIGIAAAILVIFGIGAALSLRKRKTVWVLAGKK